MVGKVESVEEEVVQEEVGFVLPREWGGEVKGEEKKAK